MRRDLEHDEAGKRGLDAGQVRGVKQAVRQDPRERLRRFHSLIISMAWVLALAGVLAVGAYYGRILWYGMALGKAGEKHYQDMVKDNAPE